MKSESIKKIVRNAQGGVDPVIVFKKRNNYGRILMDVVSSHEEPLRRLTGVKTLTDENRKALEQLGFTFEEKK